MSATGEGRLRRTWPQRFLISFNLALVVLCMLSATGLGYIYYRFGDLPRFNFSEGVLAPDPPGDPVNILLVGSDSRSFVEGGQDAESFGSVGGQRADTILLVRVDPREETAAMVSFPRDLFVTLSGSESQGRINTAFQDGPERLVNTITENFNIPVHHYAQVDFEGFRSLVEAVGGVEIFLPSPVRDRQTGLNITDTGCVSLNGEQALAYVRSREYEFMENGRFVTDLRADLGRIERQQDFIRRAIRASLSRGLTNPARLNRLVSVGIENVQVSDSLSARDIVELGQRFRSLSPETIDQYQLPVTPVSRSGAAVVVILDEDQAEAAEILDVFRGIDPADETVSPSGVRVRVLNGSGQPGQAGDTSSSLQQVQFATASPGDAPAQLDSTLIRFGPGQEAKAVLLERYLAAGAQIESAPDLQGVDVVLITGSDFAGIRAVPRPVDPATSTTAGDTTTTVAGDEEIVAQPAC